MYRLQHICISYLSHLICFNYVFHENGANVYNAAAAAADAAVVFTAVDIACCYFKRKIVFNFLFVCLNL